MLFAQMVMQQSSMAMMLLGKTVHPQTIDFDSIDVGQLLAKRRQVAIVWAIEDVQGLRPDLDDDQAWEVLQECRDKHDSEWGFTFTFIADIADELFPRPKKAG